MDVLSLINELTDLSAFLLLLFQAAVVFFLTPEEAKKYNFIGKALKHLGKTKRGFSVQKDDRANP